MTPLEPLLRELLGEALRRRRLTQRRTLADVAARAGMSMQHLSDVERGRKDPSSEMIAAICGALDLTLGQLLGLAGESEARRPVPAAVRAVPAVRSDRAATPIVLDLTGPADRHQRADDARPTALPDPTAGADVRVRPHPVVMASAA